MFYNRIRIICNFISDHILIGSPVVILTVDLILFLCVYYDFVIYDELNLSFRLSFHIAQSLISSGFVLMLLLFFGVAGFVIPAVVAVPMVYFNLLLAARNSSFYKLALQEKRRLPAFRAHLVLCFILSCMLVYTRAMSVSSGLKYYGSGYSFDFVSIYYSLIASVPSLWVYGLSFSGVFAVFGVNFVLNLQSIKEYRIRFEINKSKVDLYPRYDIKLLDFNGGASAPEVPFTRREVKGLVDKYQEMVAGSEQAKRYLVELYQEACFKIRKYFNLLKDESKGIRIFSGTSRALEVALVETLDLNTYQVMLSPYEHHSEGAVIAWCMQGRKCGYHKIQFNIDSYFESYDKQFALIADDLVGCMKKNSLAKCGNLIFVVSEVCAFTGNIINVKQLFNVIQQKVVKMSHGKSGGSKNRIEEIRVIVDGAHGAGNLVTNRSVDGGALKSDHIVKDWHPFLCFYIISAHKWLMSPEPGGVLVNNLQKSAYLKKDRQEIEISVKVGEQLGGPEKENEAAVDGVIDAYDAWGSGEIVPISTASPRVVAGIISGFRLLELRQFELLLNESIKAKREFLTWLDERSKFQLVIADDKKNIFLTGIVTIKKASLVEWREDFSAKMLIDYLERIKGIFAFVFEIDKQIFIRISFSYYVESWKVRRLTDELDKAIRNASHSF